MNDNEKIDSVRAYVFFNLQTWNPYSYVVVEDIEYIGRMVVGKNIKTDGKGMYIKDNKIYNLFLSYEDYQKFF